MHTSSFNKKKEGCQTHEFPKDLDVYSIDDKTYIMLVHQSSNKGNSIAFESMIDSSVDTYSKNFMYTPYYKRTIYLLSKIPMSLIDNPENLNVRLALSNEKIIPKIPPNFFDDDDDDNEDNFISRCKKISKKTFESIGEYKKIALLDEKDTYFLPTVESRKEEEYTYVLRGIPQFSIVAVRKGDHVEFQFRIFIVSSEKNYRKISIKP